MPQYYGDKPHDHSWYQMEPGQVEQNARRLERHSQEPYTEPGNEDGTGCQKTRETIPGTLPETTRIEEMMTEQNARLFGTKKIMVEHVFFLGRVENPIQLQNCLGNKHQERMMEQGAGRVGRQAPEP